MARYKIAKAFTRSCPCAVKDCVILCTTEQNHPWALHACMSRDVKAALRNDCDGSYVEQEYP